MVQKIAINQCYGGFGLSTEAVEWMRENDYEAGERCKLAGEEYDDGSGTVDDFLAPICPSRYKDEGFRASEGVIAVVEALGDDASGRSAEVEVIEIPDGVEWEIDEYDGYEIVEEVHRSWP